MPEQSCYDIQILDTDTTFHNAKHQFHSQIKLILD